MKPKIELVSIEALILNWELYPRHEINSANVTQLTQADEAGVDLPPVIADRKTKFVTDGFHRIESKKKQKKDRIMVEWRDYPDHAAMLEDAVKLNAPHGRGLTSYDKARCLMLAEAVGLTMDRLAPAMGLTLDRVEDLRLRKTAVDANARIVPIKQTLGHLAGQTVTDEQLAGNKKATGVRPIVYVNQIVNCLEKDLIDLEDEKLMAALVRLHGLLRRMVARQKA